MIARNYSDDLWPSFAASLKFWMTSSVAPSSCSCQVVSIKTLWGFRTSMHLTNHRLASMGANNIHDLFACRIGCLMLSGRSRGKLIWIVSSHQGYSSRCNFLWLPIYQVGGRGVDLSRPFWCEDAFPFYFLILSCLLIGPATNVIVRTWVFLEEWKASLCPYFGVVSMPLRFFCHYSCGYFCHTAFFTFKYRVLDLSIVEPFRVLQASQFLLLSNYSSMFFFLMSPLFFCFSFLFSSDNV